MRSRIATNRTEPRRLDAGRAGSDTVTELPMIEFPDADLETVVHPYAAAERVLFASS